MVKVFYMPHKAVIRQDAETTKLRIVFDASRDKRPILTQNGMFMSTKNNRTIESVKKLSKE